MSSKVESVASVDLPWPVEGPNHDKVEDIFQRNQQAIVSDVIGFNHKGHTDLIFNGLSFKGL